MCEEQSDRRFLLFRVTNHITILRTFSTAGFRIPSSCITDLQHPDFIVSGLRSSLFTAASFQTTLSPATASLQPLSTWIPSASPDTQLFFHQLIGCSSTATNQVPQLMPMGPQGSSSLATVRAFQGIYVNHLRLLCHRCWPPNWPCHSSRSPSDFCTTSLQSPSSCTAGLLTPRSSTTC